MLNQNLYIINQLIKFKKSTTCYIIISKPIVSLKLCRYHRFTILGIYLNVTKCS